MAHWHAGEGEPRRRSGRLRAIELRGRPLSSVGLHSFPHEVTLCILSHLPPAALCAVECTCRHFATQALWSGDDPAHHHGDEPGDLLLTLPERAAQLQMREVLPLLSEPEYYKNLKYGYARGHEPVQYVQRIRNYRDVIANDF